ncbi:MAG: sialidase family protein [Thermoplasmatota archaeon]
MFRSLALLGAALLVAGCLQNAAVSPASTATAIQNSEMRMALDPFHPTNGSTASATTPLKALPDVLVAQPGYAEPNIAAGYDGHTIYVGNPGGVWRSGDGGKTWKSPANRGIEGGGDGSIAVDGNGTVYYLGLFGKDNRTIPFMTSHDGAESWSPAVDLAAGSGVDREWVDVTPDSHVFAVWRGNTKGVAGIEFNGSLDGGRTWLGKVRVGADGDGGPIAHDPTSGTLVVPVIDQADTVSTGGGATVHVYVSHDQGRSWWGRDTAWFSRSSPIEPNGYVSDFPVATFDGSGTLYLVYSADSGTTPQGLTPPEETSLYGIFLQVSHDDGQTWSKPKLISDPSKDARFPWIAAGAPGRIAVVWYENVHGTPGELVPDQWNVKLYESLNAAAPDGKGQTITLTSAPNHVGALCTAGATCAVDDRSMLDFFQVAISRAGEPLVAFAESTLGTGVGPAVKSTEIHFATADGPSLV